MILKHQILQLPGRVVRSKDRPHVPGSAITVKATVTDAGSPVRATLLRSGFVLGRAADGFYYAADDPLVVPSQGASVLSKIALGAGAAGKTFLWRYKDGPEQTVTGGAGETSAAAWATVLNASAHFSADLLARDDGTGKLKIETKRAGADEYFKVTEGTLNGQGGAPEDTFDNDTSYEGQDADFRVLEDYLDLLGETGIAEDALADKNTKAGTYKESSLVKLTPEAKALLLRRGSQFE